jgi:hypothetical protein
LQMKSMKMIYNLKSILSKGFEYDEEREPSIRSQNTELISCSMNSEWNVTQQYNVNCLNQLKLQQWKHVKMQNHW